MIDKKFFAACALLSVAAASACGAELKRETLQAFEKYARGVEQRLDTRMRSGPFLWAETQPARMKQVRDGQIVIQPLVGKGDTDVHDGLVHDWVGAVFVPGATLDHALSVVQDYNSHKNTHRPEVLDSRLMSRSGNDFHIYLRVMKKKVLTVVLNTEHDVHYFPVDLTKCYSRSYSTRIAEVKSPGHEDEKELPVGQGHGFLWRLYSYWTFEQRDGGVYMECEALSLTRDVPTGLGWLIEPIIRNLPRESLHNTLQCTRDAIVNRPRTSAQSR